MSANLQGKFMSSAASSARRFTAHAEDVGTLRPGPSLTRAAVCGWLGFAFLLFLLQALPYLSYRWVTDESWYAAPAYSLLQGHGIANPAIGPNDLENHFDTRSSGSAVTIASAFRLFGIGAIPARLGSLFAGLAIVFLVYRLARNFIGQQGALIATFLVATDNIVVLTSRTARPEVLTAAAVLASLVMMQQYAWEARIAWAFLSGLFMAMGTMFHVMLLGYIVSVGILVIVLDRQSDRFPLRGAIPYAFGYFLGLVPFVFWVLTNSAGRASFREEYLGRATNSPLWPRFLGEVHRYYDLLGLDMLHGHGLESIPIRLPIPLFFLASSFLLWKLRRHWFYLEVLLLVPTMLWFLYLTTTKSSRYFVLITPIFALTLGAAVVAMIAHRKLQRFMLVLFCLVVVAQMSANLFLLYGARKANYNKVTLELRSVIPPGQTAYGTITFWLALHDRPFISYERTDPWMAVNQFHARYFITGDRAMTSGLLGDEAFMIDLNRHLAEVIAQSKLVGHFPDPYYGDLKVYELPAP